MSNNCFKQAVVASDCGLITSVTGLRPSYYSPAACQDNLSLAEVLIFLENSID